MLLLAIFFYNHTISKNSISPNGPLAYQATASKEENISLTLAQKLLIANQIYNFIQKQYALDKQLSDARKKIRSKNILTLRHIIGTGIVTSILAGPALTVNYLNKYITPEKYQNIVEKISAGSAGVIGAIGAFGLAREGAKSFYDIFMYEREQKAVEQEIKKLQNDRSQINKSIENIENQYPDIFATPALNYDQQKTYEDFINFYNSNYSTIDKQKINTFLQTHPNYSVDSLLDLCKQKKINIILTMIKPKSTTFLKSSGNLALDIVVGVLLAPWYLIFAAAAMSENKQEQEFKEVDTLNEIIRKLTIFASQ